MLRDSDGARSPFRRCPFPMNTPQGKSSVMRRISTPADVIEAQLTAARAHVPKGARWGRRCTCFRLPEERSEKVQRALTRVGGIETVPAEVFEGAELCVSGAFAQTTGSGGSANIRPLWCAAGLWVSTRRETKSP